jgi:hypothetical protein
MQGVWASLHPQSCCPTVATVRSSVANSRSEDFTSRNAFWGSRGGCRALLPRSLRNCNVLGSGSSTLKKQFTANVVASLGVESLEGLFAIGSLPGVCLNCAENFPTLSLLYSYCVVEGSVCPFECQCTFLYFLSLAHVGLNKVPYNAF